MQLKQVTEFYVEYIGEEADKERRQHDLVGFSNAKLGELKQVIESCVDWIGEEAVKERITLDLLGFSTFSSY